MNIICFNCLLFFCFIFPLISFCEKIKISDTVNTDLSSVSNSSKGTELWDKKEMIYSTLPASKMIAPKTVSNLSDSMGQWLSAHNQTKDKSKNTKIHSFNPIEFVNIGKSENYYGKIVIIIK